VAEIEDRFPPGGHGSILWVDDNPLLTDIGRRLLDKLGYRVTAFSDSEAALAHFRENVRSFDRVITDMRMPKMTGIELGRAVKKIHPEIPIILCTGNSDSISVQDRRDAGINDLAAKPLNLHQIAALIRTNVDRHKVNRTTSPIPG
jgi:two-component system cell cycle sensor histidine kinase/response regulator CckA